MMSLSGIWGVDIITICLQFYTAFKIAIEKMSLPMIDGATLDWKVNGINEEFTFRNPNEQNRCGCGVSAYF